MTVATLDRANGGVVTILDQIRGFIARTAKRHVNEITPDLMLGQDLGFDSLDRAELMMEVEDLLDLTLDEDAFQDADTVADIYFAVDQALN